MSPRISQFSGHHREMRFRGPSPWVWCHSLYLGFASHPPACLVFEPQVCHFPSFPTHFLQTSALLDLQIGLRFAQGFGFLSARTLNESLLLG